ncbi:hypothetical protein NQ318_003823 [Aromia moschata]|uniref:Uncharacterized protein n=1 Tax=Aromia moschata TaxID=1265417 RepID=A0AAV8XWT8_9CUCU|nr:hypothetical protein NQ318_003823 [Aromia moschata]
MEPYLDCFSLYRTMQQQAFYFISRRYVHDVQQVHLSHMYIDRTANVRNLPPYLTFAVLAVLFRKDTKKNVINSGMNEKDGNRALAAADDAACLKTTVCKISPAKI